MNSKYKVAIIGCGEIAGGYDEKLNDESIYTHAKAYLSHGGFELIAAMDPDKAKLDHFLDTWKVPSGFSDLGSLLQVTSPEVVSICSPNEFHFSQLKLLANFPSIKAVICEKPLALSEEDAISALNLFNANKKLLLVNYLRQWDSLISSLKNRFEKNSFGSPLRGRVLYTKGVFHNASHAINLLETWFGPARDIVGVSVYKLDSTDIIADFSLTFANDVNVFFQSLPAEHYNIFEMEFFTPKSRVRINHNHDLEIQDRIESKIQNNAFTLSSTRIEKGTLNFAMPNVISNLYEALRSGTPLKMQPHQATQTISTCEKIKTVLGKHYGK